MRQRIGLVGAVIVGVFSGFAVADPRPFTFSNDTYPMGKGDWEYEQWITFSGEAEDNASAKAFVFRHEFEFGVADNFDLAIYFPEWAIEKDDDDWDTEFEGGSLEAIVYLSNPVTDFVGIGLYGEIGVGEDELEFEQKLLVQKDIGNWIFLYNLVIETELEHVFEKDEETEVEGVLEHTFGVSYAIASGWLLGGELIIASEYEDWEEYEGTTAYAGPVISYQGGQIGEEGGWWVTVTPTMQITNKDEEPDLVARMLFGISF
jgi:hypothetical protein